MTEQQTDANDVLMGGGGAPTARFDRPGITIGGRIVAKPRSHHEREYDPRNPGHGAPKYFPSGDAIMGITVDVQTATRDASIPDDTGVRRIYIEGKRMKDAVRTAIRATGATGLEVGGELYVTHTGREPDERGQITDQSPKTWDARYVPAVSAHLNTGQTERAVAQTAPPVTNVANTAPPEVTPPVQQAPAQPVANGPSPEAVAALRAAGVDPATVFPGYVG